MKTKSSENQALYNTRGYLRMSWDWNKNLLKKKLALGCVELIL